MQRHQLPLSIHGVCPIRYLAVLICYKVDINDTLFESALHAGLQAQLTQEVKRADSLSAELGRQQEESSRGLKGTKSHRGTGDILTGRTPTQGGGDPLIPASRPAGAASTAGSELELLRRKLKVGCFCCCTASTHVL